MLEGKYPQEDHINKLGMHLGWELRDMAKNGIDPKSQPAPYINLSEFNWEPPVSTCLSSMANNANLRA